MTLERPGLPGLQFALERPQIVAVDASPTGNDHEDHEFWRISVNRDLEEPPLSHVVIATLHISRDEGQSSVTMGGTLTEVVDLSGEDEKSLLELIGSSTALDAMYDLIRATMRAVCAVADIDFEIPREPPVPELYTYDADADGDESTSVQNELEE